MEAITELEICEKLKKLYDESEGRVKADAFVCRAYIEKASSDTINKKVNDQMNSIRVGIYDVNPNFKENSKNYDQIKQKILETVANYKDVLLELSKFYDTKIEQLILRKVELEASLVGSLLNEEYLARNIGKKEQQKENDKVKKSIKENVKLVLEKLKSKKKENTPIDANMIFDLLDSQDVANELEEKNVINLENAVNNKKENKTSIEKIEKEIALINAEIERLNDQKVKSLYDAMEVGDKSITKVIRKPKMFKKITKFFASRFNTAKVVETTIINPLNLRIENFRNNEFPSIEE